MTKGVSSVAESPFSNIVARVYVIRVAVGASVWRVVIANPKEREMGNTGTTIKPTTLYHIALRIESPSIL